MKLCPNCKAELIDYRIFEVPLAKNKNYSECNRCRTVFTTDLIILVGEEKEKEND